MDIPRSGDRAKQVFSFHVVFPLSRVFLSFVVVWDTWDTWWDTCGTHKNRLNPAWFLAWDTWDTSFLFLIYKRVKRNREYTGS